MSINTTPTAKWIFIGDSITDSDRTQDPENMGSGYVRLVRDWMRARNPAGAPQVINHGTGGHKIGDLAERWQRDVLDERPALVSIMIGINDVWQKLMNWGPGTPLDAFLATYRDLLRRLRQSVPGCMLVVCEPTVIGAPQPEDGNDRLQPYIQGIRALAKEFSAEFVVPLHAIFRDAVKARPDVAWTKDGVHPLSSGYMLIARTWLGTVAVM